MLADEMFFEQCVAFALLMQIVNQTSAYTNRLSLVVMRHTNNVLTRLRERMSTGHGTDDPTILTMTSLAAVSVCSDYYSFYNWCS
jgi:hypothetical protein